MNQIHHEQPPTITLTCGLSQDSMDILTALAIVDSSVSLGEQMRRGIGEYLVELPKHDADEQWKWRPRGGFYTPYHTYLRPVSVLIDTVEYRLLHQFARRNSVSPGSLARAGIERYIDTRLSDPELPTQAEIVMRNE